MLELPPAIWMSCASTKVGRQGTIAKASTIDLDNRLDKSHPQIHNESSLFDGLL